MSENDDENDKIREISRGEKAFFSGLKWLLVSIVLGTVIVVFVEYSQTLRTIVTFMCLSYIVGTFYRWNRMKQIREASKQ